MQDEQAPNERTDDAERALTIREFCQRNRMVSSTYHALQRAGLGPAEMRFGRWIRIPPEAEAAWRASMAAASTTSGRPARPSSGAPAVRPPPPSRRGGRGDQVESGRPWWTHPTTRP